MTCCFFGHEYTPEEIRPKLRDVLEELVAYKNADNFLVGNHGDFDRMVKQELIRLKKKYKNISYNIVLAYMPREKGEFGYDMPDAIYPDGLEKVPYKFAIYHRNMWMIKNSQTVVAYVNGNTGRSGTFVEKARKRGLDIINLA